MIGEVLFKLRWSVDSCWSVSLTADESGDLLTHIAFLEAHIENLERIVVPKKRRRK